MKQLHAEAVTLRDRGRLAEAMAAIERALILRPGDAALENQAGLIALADNRFLAAIDYFRRSLTHARLLDAKDREILVDNYLAAVNGLVPRLLTPTTSDGRGGQQPNPEFNPTQAMSLCREALALRDSDVRMLSYVGLALSNTGAPLEALHYFEKAYREAVARASEGKLSAGDHAAIRNNYVGASINVAWALKDNSAESVKHMARAYDVAQRSADVRTQYLKLLEFHGSRFADQKQFHAANLQFNNALDLIRSNSLDDAQAAGLKAKFAAVKIAESVNQPEHYRLKLLAEARQLDPSLHETRGLSGGMVWVPGIYLRDMPTRSDPDRSRKEREYMIHLGQAGITAERRRILADYDFVLGLAQSRTVLGDLVRVSKDELSSGRASRASQAEYDKIRGKTFETLDCHSNGAMICLAALANGDIEAKSVRLLGPQITPDALREWNSLLQSHRGRLEKLEIVFNASDPVPYLSAWAGSPAGRQAGWMPGDPVPPAAPAGDPREGYPFLAGLFDEKRLEEFIRHHTPAAAVTVRTECQFGGAMMETPLPSFSSAFYCHDIKMYGGM